jgi:hypothetical protein
MPLCEYDGCKTESSFNFKGMPRKYCSKHKEPDMLNVKDFICIFDCCFRPAYYNFIGLKNKLYCFQHKLDNMINVKNKLCQSISCNKQPLFNYKNQKEAIYCYEHKIPTMIDIKHTNCISDNCQSRGRYNFVGNKPIYCFNHKLENMIDIDAKKCKFDNCLTTPQFNYENELSSMYCSKHKLVNMIDIKNKKCIFDNCKKKPSFNYIGQKEWLYCLTHKLDGMINITINKCKTPLCETKGNLHYENYCLRCYIHIYPDKKNCRNYKTKEQTVIDYVKTTFPELTIVTDKINPDGCSKKRPDILIDLGYQIIIIEIDENQHKFYDAACENKRTMEISQDNQHRPIIFIRFNPDKYMNNGIKIQSCWKLSKLNIVILDKSKKLEWENRLSQLKQQIEFWINPCNVSNKTIHTEHLFYDI